MLHSYKYKIHMFCILTLHDQIYPNVHKWEYESLLMLIQFYFRNTYENVSG